MLTASGTAPNNAARVVIMIGLKRRMHALRIASRGVAPPVRSASSAKSIIMIAFFLTIPISKMSPISAMTSSEWFASIRVNSAPMPADGSVERIVTG